MSFNSAKDINLDLLEKKISKKKKERKLDSI
jgi:hypothetical protein